MKHIKAFQAAHGLTADGIIGKNTLKKMKSVWGLNNEQLANMLGQVSHETGGFQLDTENLNYSVKGLLDTFGKYFTEGRAKVYARRPEWIANYVYANRNGNGNEESGDGWKYRGRGAIQLTGKENYQKFAAWLKEPMLCPDEVATKYFWETALFFFTVNGLWISKVDIPTITRISKRINGGTNGLQDRINKTLYYYQMTSKL